MPLAPQMAPRPMAQPQAMPTQGYFIMQQPTQPLMMRPGMVYTTPPPQMRPSVAPAPNGAPPPPQQPGVRPLHPQQLRPTMIMMGPMARWGRTAR